MLKIGFVLFTFVFIYVGFSTPHSTSIKCNDCISYMTQEDSLNISRAFKKRIDSVIIQKQEQIDCINDSVYIIKAQLNENKSPRSSTYIKGKR